MCDFRFEEKRPSDWVAVCAERLYTEGVIKEIGGQAIIDKHKYIACGHLPDVEAREVGAVGRQRNQ